MLLHTLCAPPSSSAFKDCLAVAAPGDTILLLGDGVYAALTHHPGWKMLRNTGAAIHILDVDAEAAGIRNPAGDTTVIDMDGFVALTERCAQQIAWY